MKVEGKNIVLTGASSGIGLELLNILSAYEGVKIVAAARHIETIPLKDGIVFPFSADLSTQEGVDALFNYSMSVVGNIDILIANAGYAYMERLESPDWKHIEDIFALNTFSPIYSLEKLIKQNLSHQKYFICTSSAVAMIPLPYYSLYSSTKAAIHQFLEAYRYETVTNSLRVMTVYPVATRTAFFEKAAQAKQPPLPFLTQDPHTVAKAIVEGIRKNKQKVYPSLLFRIFNRIISIFPFLFRVYSWNEKRKIEKYLGL